MQTPETVLAYWLDEVGPEGWYAGGEALDADIRDKFAETWEAGVSGGCGLWLTYPLGTLAYIILMDQFPRNMFRGTRDAFVTDCAARAAAKSAIKHGWDMRVDEPARQFFYLPLMHSESLVDQDRCVRLIATRMPETGAHNMTHARAHREVIRWFGRFPTRNAALGRRSTQAETVFLTKGGYKAAMDAVSAETAA